MTTYTLNRVGVVREFADPYKKCNECQGWITGAVEFSGLPLMLVPCEHFAAYTDVCPSWGPVDGCKCPLGERGHGKG
jgi:hypothetical protein